MTDTLTPVPVVVHNTADLHAGRCPRCGGRAGPLAAQCRTVILVTPAAQAQTNVQTNAQELLPQDDGRCWALVQSLDHAVIVAHSKSQAMAGTNLTDTNLAAPDGFVLQSTNTMWTPVEGKNRLFVSGPSNNSRVTVIAFIHKS